MERLPTDSRESVTWISGRPLPAGAISAGLHGAALLLAAYLCQQVPQGQPPDAAPRPVGVALVQQTTGVREYALAGAATASAAADAGNEQTGGTQVAAGLPSEAELQVDLSGALPGLNEALGGGESLAAPADGTGGSDAASRRGLVEQVRTTVFGASGSGTKFIYVFDRSGSMASLGGRPLAAAKSELVSSLRDLHETNQFQIIFYNNEPHVFRIRPGTPAMVWGTDDAKRAATRFVQGITAAGSTRHLEPLRMAISLQPDVIFFLTDADEPQLTEAELQQVRRWNQGSAINAIEFGSGPQTGGDGFLTRLAQENGGQHVYVDVSQLNVSSRAEGGN